MSKNTKRETYKEYLALQRREDKLYEEKKNLGYRELEKPIHHGYTAYLELREDVLRRTDKEGLAYQYIIKHFSTETWGKTIDFYKKSKKTWYSFDYDYVTPKIRKITEREFEALHPSIAKYFYNYKIDNKYHWGGLECRYYTNVIPEHYVVIKVKKDYLTHQKIIDSELEREAAFVEDKISAFYNTTPYFRDSGIGKWFRTNMNRRDRYHNKRALKYNLSQVIENDSYDRYKESLDIHNLEMEALGQDDYIFEVCTKKEWEEEVTCNDWGYVSGWEHDPKEFKYKHRHGGRWYWW